MNNRTFLTRFVAIMVGTAFAAALAGGLFGFSVYQVIMDRDTEGEFLANLLQAIIATVAGFVAAATVYLYGTHRLAVYWLEDRYSKAIYIRLALGAVIWPLLSIMPRFFFGPLSPVLAAVLTIAILLPVGNKRVRTMLAGGAVAIGLLVSATQYAVALQLDEQEYSRSFADWNGPLLLVNGNSASVAGPEWVPLSVDAPYGNESYATVTLQNRRYGPDESEDNYSVSMHNTPLEEVCTYDTSCTKAFDSKFGPVYKIEYMTGYAVAVPNGHVEVDDDYDDVDPQAVINSLQPVDAATFTAVVDKIKE